MTAPRDIDHGTPEPAEQAPRPPQRPPGGHLAPPPTQRPGQGQQGAPSPAAPPGAVPRAGAGRPPTPDEPGPGWAATTRPAAADAPATTVLPATSPTSRPPRPGPARPPVRGDVRPAAAGSRPVAARARRTRLALRRVDPWSVFVFSLIAAVFLGIALIVAVAALYAVLGSLGVTESLNQLYGEVTGASATDTPLLTGGRIVGGAAVLAAVNVVLLTLLATLGALLYNLCASFTGGLELTLGERE